MPLRRWFGHVPPAEARAAALALVVGALLTVTKFLAYFLTGSAAIFSDAMESIVNLAAATFALYSLAVAHLPADAEHPYGHGKVEFLAAGFEGGMILLAGIVALLKAADVLFRRGPTVDPSGLGLGLLLMSATLLVNAGLGLYLLRAGRRQKSLTLEADGHHLLTDAWTSVATVIALVIVRLTGWVWADPIAAAIVAIFIGYVGIGLLRRAEAGLMDRQDADDERLLREILDAHLGADRPPQICGYHKLRHRHSGRYHWVDFHLVVPATWDVRRGHEVATVIEQEIQAALGEGNATAHVEPCQQGECPQCSARPATM